MGLMDLLRKKLSAPGFSDAEVDSIIAENPQVLEWDPAELTIDKTRSMYNDPERAGSVVAPAASRGRGLGVYLAGGEYDPKGAADFLSALKKRLTEKSK